MGHEVEVDRVVEDLIRTGRIFVAIAANSLTGEGGELSLQQYRALALLGSQDGQRPADLARSLGVTPSTTTALCDRLVQKGMISRRRRGADRRSVYLVVSPRGREQLAIVAERRSSLLREMFLRIPAPRRERFAQALPALIEAAGEIGIDEWSIRGL